METILQRNRYRRCDRRQRPWPSVPSRPSRPPTCSTRSRSSASTAAPTSSPPSRRAKPATVLQPAALIAEMAVEQADEFVKTGKASQPEKQSIDCELVTKDNADEFGVFAKKS